MKDEDIQQLVAAVNKAVDERVAEALKPILEAQDELKKDLGTVTKALGEVGEDTDIVKALKEFQENGDQVVRQLLVGNAEENKPGMVTRIKAIEDHLTTRKSLTSEPAPAPAPKTPAGGGGEDTTVSKAEDTIDDVLDAAVTKAVTERGTLVSLGKGD